MEQLTQQSIKGYELRECLGTGGFGAVYRAYQGVVGREVAIKVILPNIANHPDFIRRFEIEAQIIARLEHLHIVPLYDYWRDPGGAYLVMRWLKGGSLREALTNGAYDLGATVILIDQIAAALDIAHRNGVIHRDLKPANILLDEEGNAYLADFGIAKDQINPQGSNTAEDVIVGSLDYISPEQARSEPVTPRTDIYSLGVVLYELLTGQHPFPNLSSVERLYKHLNEPLPIIDTPLIPENVNTVIQKATAKNPLHRYADVLEMAAALRQIYAANSQQSAYDPAETLTLREQEVLTLVIEGLSNKEIAHKLTFTLGTVKWYITQIYKKLHVRTRVQAIIRARELNLIRPVQEEFPTTLGTMISPPRHLPNPYKGLQAFKAADHADFFGQEKLITKLLKRLGEFGDYSRFLAITGPSGSGKSSVVKAGVIPALWRGDLPGSERWFIAEMQPGSHPLDEMGVALTRIAANQTGDLQAHLARDKRGLIRAAQLILPDDGSDLVLVVDQLEEIFTLVTDEAERQHFLTLLQTAVSEARSRVRVIVTLRADFYDRPLQYPEFGEMLRSRMETILPLSSDGLERAIVRPAERMGIAFEAGLVATIIEEVHYQPGALPLLQYALTELFEQRQGCTLSHKAYQSIGGTTGALAKRAEQTWLELPTPLQAVARQLFLRLVTLGEGVEDTRRRAARSELLAITAESDQMDEVIDTFAAYRLLALDHDPATHTPTVEVAHEALLREWSRLHQWLNESRNDIRLQRQLAQAAAQWQTADQDSSYLLTGSHLEQYERWSTATSLALTPLERAFIQASLHQRAQQQADEAVRQAREQHLVKRSRTFLYGLVAMLTAATVITLSLLGLVFNRNQRTIQALSAEQDARATSEAHLQWTEALRLSASANTLLPGEIMDAELAALLAIRSLRLKYTIQADQALNHAIPLLYTEHIIPNTVTPFIWRGSFSPDGTLVAAPNTNHQIEVRTVADWQLVATLEGHTAAVINTAWSPNGRYLFSVGQDLTGRMWNMLTYTAVYDLPLEEAPCCSSKFSPDSRLVAINKAHGVTVIDAATGEALFELVPNPYGYRRVFFTPDSKSLLISDNTTISTWHYELAHGTLLRQMNYATLAISGEGLAVWLQTGKPGYVDLAHPTQPEAFRDETARNWGIAAFSPDGRQIALGDSTGLVVLREVATGELLARLTGHSAGVYALEFSPDGRQLLSAGNDSLLRLWDTTSGEQLRWYSALEVPRFSPDGQHILAESKGGIVLVDARLTSTPRLLSGHTGKVWSLAFAPDGQSILSSTPQETYYWNVLTGEYQEIGGGGLSALSPDGEVILAASSTSPAVSFISMATGERLQQVRGDNAMFGRIAISINHLGAVSYSSGSIYVWNANSPDPLYILDMERATYSYPVFTPDGMRLFSASQDGKVMLWNMTSGELIGQAETGSDAPVHGVAVSPDGSYAATIDDASTTILWRIDGELEKLQTLYHGQTGIYSIAFSPDGRSLVTGGNDGTLILWNWQQGAVVRQIKAHEGWVVSVAFSPDGLLIASGGEDRLIRLWDAEVEGLITYACSRIFRDLLPTERQQLNITDNLSTCP